MNVSIAMATFNGAKYIKEQIESIVSQLAIDDELIISDDGSTDGTLDIIHGFLADNRVKLYEGPSKGVVKNFENAIAKTTKEIIILSDQDDVWLPTRVETIKEKFSDPSISLLITNAKCVDANLNALYDTKAKHLWRKGIVSNFIKNTYVGSRMAFREELKRVILPFPPKLPMHDMWIGLLVELKKKRIAYVDEELMLYRRHENTVTTEKRNKLWKIICWRINLFKSLCKRCTDLRGVE